MGTNRPQPGFRQLHRARSHSGTPPDSEGDAPGPSAALTQDENDNESEDESEDGGITLNLDKTIREIQARQDKQDVIVLSDDSDTHERLPAERSKESSDEEGETHTQSEGDPPTPTDVEQPRYIIDSNPTKLQVSLRLSQLSLDDLEDQFRYAYYHLPRNEIDLNRLARCLSCFAEGHLATACPLSTCQHCSQPHYSYKCPKVQRCSRCRARGHNSTACKEMKNNTIPCDICHQLGHVEFDCSLRYYAFPALASDNLGQVDLWVSCAACASKHHLVGDCPDLVVSSRFTARWSLKTVKPDLVRNLSIQSDTHKREKEAAARGLRPPGSITVRGRANRAPLGNSPPADSDDSLDQFLHHPLVRNSRAERRRSPFDTNRLGNNSRYDRYDAPSSRDTYRPPNNAFYSTDSFGRSRSPTRYNDHSGRRRSPSPRGNDNYRPSGGHRPANLNSINHNPASRNAPGPPPRSGNKGISISLPARNGGRSTAPARSAPTAIKPRANKRDGGAMMGNHQVTK